MTGSCEARHDRGNAIAGDDPVRSRILSCDVKTKPCVSSVTHWPRRFTHLEEKIARAWVVGRRDRGDVAMNHAAELPAEISRIEQDLEGVLADRDHWREEREREARCQLTRRLAELLRKWGTR